MVESKYSPKHAAMLWKINVTATNLLNATPIRCADNMM